MSSYVVLPAAAARSAAIVVVFLVTGFAIAESAFAHSGGGQGAQGPSSRSALAPGHAQDPPGRRAHGNPSHPASHSQSAHGEAEGHGSRPAATNTDTRHPSHGHDGQVTRPHPATAESTPQSSVPPQNGHHKTTICHATGSATNPYVEISIPPPAVRAHSRHQDGRDIIPAPAGGCPGATAAAPSTAQQPGAVGTVQPAAPTASQTVAGVIAAMPLATPPRSSAAADHAVLGVEASSKEGAAASRPLRDASPAASRDGGGGLPFTGFGIALVAALGIALTAAGAGVRRHSRA